MTEIVVKETETEEVASPQPRELRVQEEIKNEVE